MIASNLWSRPLIKQCWLRRTKVCVIAQEEGRRWERKGRKSGGWERKKEKREKEGERRQSF